MIFLVLNSTKGAEENWTLGRTIIPLIKTCSFFCEHRNADIELYQNGIFTSAFPIKKHISVRRRIVDIVSAT